MALTTRFGFEIPDVGLDTDTWGDILNAYFNSLEGQVLNRKASDTINGALTATSFSGDGANLTNLNASNLATGTVPTARLVNAVNTAALQSASVTADKLAPGLGGAPDFLIINSGVI